MTESQSFAPLSTQRWSDFETLFGTRGACGGCWCMYWRQRGKAWTQRQPEQNKARMRELVERGPAPGVLAYAGTTPVGWCQIGPHGDFLRFVHSRTRQPLDNVPTWIINCFFIARPWRGRGLTVPLIRAAVEHAREHGAQRVEGFPLKPQAPRVAATFAYVGSAGAFERAGFHRVVDPAEIQAPRYRCDVDS